MAITGVVTGGAMTGFGLAHGETNVSDQGTTVFIGSLLAGVILLLCRSMVKQRSLQGEHEELDRERGQLYAARAALDQESERLCRESDVNDRKRDEKAQLERESDQKELQFERDVMQLEFENARAEIEANAYAKGLAHAQRGFIDDAPGDAVVIHLPFARAHGKDDPAPRANEH
jgi:hypothetical protein